MLIEVLIVSKFYYFLLKFVYNDVKENYIVT